MLLPDKNGQMKSLDSRGSREQEDCHCCWSIPWMDFRRCCSLQSLNYSLYVLKGLHTGSVLLLFVIVWMLTLGFYSVFQYLHPLKAELYRETTRAIRKIARNCIQTRLNEIEHGEPPRNDIVGSIIEAISEFPSHQWDPNQDASYTFLWRSVFALTVVYECHPC